MVLLKNDKEQQLDELVTIVTGIRLFNKACRTGAEQSELRELSNVEKHSVLKCDVENRKTKEFSCSLLAQNLWVIRAEVINVPFIF